MSFWNYSLISYFTLKNLSTDLLKFQTKAFGFKGLRHLTPTRGSAPKARWGLRPRPPYRLALRSRTPHVLAPNLKTKRRPCLWPLTKHILVVSFTIFLVELMRQITFVCQIYGFRFLAIAHLKLESPTGWSLACLTAALAALSLQASRYL